MVDFLIFTSDQLSCVFLFSNKKIKNKKSCVLADWCGLIHNLNTNLYIFLFSKLSNSSEMFSKSRTLSDKIRLFLQNKADSSQFLRYSSMSLERISKVQAIYDFCKKNLTPSAAPLSSQTVQKLCSLLGNLSLFLLNFYCILFYFDFRTIFLVVSYDFWLNFSSGFKVQVN